MSKYKNRIIAVTVIAVILIVSFVFGGNIPKETTPAATQAPTASPVPVMEQIPAPTPEFTTSPKTETLIAPIATEAPTEKPVTPTPAPTQLTPQTTTAPESDINKDLTCTISIACNTIFSNMSFLTEGKQNIVPTDGVILKEKTAVFYEGESVFNVLARECRQNNIHLEFVNVPFYNSAYIEGIGNLYEFDCGELSGWMYKVNGDFPQFGCSQYTLKKDDKIEWVYTCDSGKDVGDNSGTRNGFNKGE